MESIEIVKNLDNGIYKLKINWQYILQRVVWKCATKCRMKEGGYEWVYNIHFFIHEFYPYELLMDWVK